MLYTRIPVVPMDFDGAVAAHAETLKAIAYWKDMKRYASWTEEYKMACNVLPRWQQIKDTAQATIQSYQLKLF